MHLVFLNQYHPPDAAPTGVMLKAVVEELAAQGHEVSVICTQGGYADTPSRMGEDAHNAPLQETPLRVIRIRATRFGRGTFLGKLADYVSYYAGVAWRLWWLNPRPDRVVALTTPPYLGVLARAMSRLRGADHAHWVMDLYPDVMVAHGMLREGGPAHRMLARLARWGFGGKRCAALLTLGPDMAQRLGNLINDRPTPDGGKSKVHGFTIGWVPLWSTVENGTVDETAVAKRRHEMGWRDDELVVMYSGNMGLGHRFTEILEVIQQNVAAVHDRRSECEAASPSTPTIHHPKSSARFVFFGDGRRRVEIERFMAEHPDAPVELHDYAPADALGVHLRSADVHLASLAAGWTGTMLPSKLQGIFAAARPVIFIGDENSAIAGWVRESGGGWVVAPAKTKEFALALGEAHDPETRESRGRAAMTFASANFDRNTNIRRIAGILIAGEIQRKHRA